MGLYAIDCPVCKKGHLWFSGNLDQRCQECQNKTKETKKMTKAKLEARVLELEKKIALLETHLLTCGCNCFHPNWTYQPVYQPFYTTGTLIGGSTPNSAVNI